MEERLELLNDELDLDVHEGSVDVFAVNFLGHQAPSLDENHLVFQLAELLACVQFLEVIVRLAREHCLHVVVVI